MKLDVMGPAEVADYCGVHVVTVGRWVKQGVLPGPDCRLAIGAVWRGATIRDWWTATRAAADQAAQLPRAARSSR